MNPVTGKLQAHGQYMCRCGRKLAGCHCPDHQKMINKVYDGCVVCKPDTRSLKEKMRVQEKDA